MNGNQVWRYLNKVPRSAQIKDQDETSCKSTFFDTDHQVCVAEWRCTFESGDKLTYLEEVHLVWENGSGEIRHRRLATYQSSHHSDDVWLVDTGIRIRGNTHVLVEWSDSRKKDAWTHNVTLEELKKE